MNTTTQVSGGTPHSSGDPWVDFVGTSDVMGSSQLHDAPPPTQTTQQEAEGSYGLQLPTRDRHPPDRYTPSAYDHPREEVEVDVPASARRAKACQSQGPGKGSG